MRKKALLILRCIAFVLAIVSGVRSTPAQRATNRYFPETGHSVEGELLWFYEAVPNPLELYGNPITDAFPEPGTNRTIQYFERARFVLDPDAPAELRVQISPLGKLLYRPEAATPQPQNTTGCRFYPETGFQICYAFLDFFDANGGVKQFGYPISNFELYNGYIVQYFQRARFEWRPEFPVGQRVVLGDLGREYFRFVGEDPNLLSPSQESYLPQSILSLRVRAFVHNSVMPFRGKQTLFVVVQDQNLIPVSDARVTYEIRLPGKSTETYSMPLTDENGISQVSFPVDAPIHGIAEIVVTVTFDAFRDQTITEFRIWW